MKVHYVRNPFEHNEKVKKYNKDITFEPSYDPEVADVIVCGGGDGTLLKCIKEYRYLNKPFWGFNAGNVGFLMNKNFPNTYSTVQGEGITIKTFNLIKVVVTYTESAPDAKLANIYDKDVVVHRTYQAFNDVMLGGDMNSYISFRVREKENIIGDVSGGGLIISTPQGSTAINKNNRGSVLSLESNLWIFTGDKTSRAINAVMKPRKTVIAVKSRTPVSLWVDGANTVVRNVSKIVVTKGDEVKVMFGDYSEFQKKRRI